MKKILFVLVTAISLSSCTPKVGSPEWCKKMEEKDKGDWTINEAKDYAKHCIFK
jgi:hypothetical protein